MVRTPSRRGRLIAAAAALLLLLAIDLSRPPRRQVSARLLLGGIDLYQAMLSPVLGKAGARCRFQPTCSHYGEGAIRKYGALQGSWKAAGRIVRCGPWTPAGTVDPP
jgi:putative membrane protein insertion efficiency factor